MSKKDSDRCKPQNSHFDNKVSQFCETINSSLEQFILQDPEVLSRYKDNLDVIFYFLTFNYRCTCTENTEYEPNEETITYEMPHKKNNKITLDVQVAKCDDLQIKTINKITEVVCCFNAEFKYYFSPCLKRLSINERLFNRSCKQFDWFVSVFCKIITFFLKERNDSFISRNFVELILNNCNLYEIQSLFYLCLTKNTFILYFNQINIVIKFNNQLSLTNINTIHILNYLLEKRNQKTKHLIQNGWNYAKFFETLCKHGEEQYLNMFFELNNEYDYTVVFNFLCKILETEGDHLAFVQTFHNFLKSTVYDFSPQSIDLRFLYVTKLLGFALKYHDIELLTTIEHQRIFQQLFDVFFRFEDCTFHHSNTVFCIEALFSQDLEINFRLVIIAINASATRMAEWGREFFARENEPNGVIPSLHAYCLELYNEYKKLYKRCNTQDKRVLKIKHTLDKCFNSEAFYYIKWYFKKCSKKEKLELDNEEMVGRFLDDCTSETHIRYIYSEIIQKFQYNCLFDML